MAQVTRLRLVSREYKYLDPGRAGLFAATVPPAVSKLLCVWALKHGHEHFVADISDAFLNVDQGKKLSVLLPGTKQWVLLWKMLPGQSAAAANWADRIAADVKSFGFKPCRVCPTVFVKDGVALAIHVDDLYVTGKCAEVEGFLNQLEMKYRLKKSGPHGIGDSFYFLKRRFAVTEFGICVTPNPKYKEKLLSFIQDDKGKKGRNTPTPSGYQPVPVKMQDAKDLLPVSICERCTKPLPELVCSLFWMHACLYQRALNNLAAARITGSSER